MTVSIIIAVKTWQKNLEECVGKCQELDFPDFEIIILPDSDIGTVPALAKILSTKGTVPIKFYPTGPVSPAQKRDIAIDYAKGEILAFIDDDAYPAKDWLKNAIKNFIDPQVAAVGGPAITPRDDSVRQKASGLIYSSPLVSAKFVYRYLPRTIPECHTSKGMVRGLPKKKIEVDDYPSCNFLIRKSIMQELGGFNTNFWPGEDSKLCLDITKTLNKKIVYDPTVIVYHHRRPLFLPHLKQVANYALHRGYFVKRYPQTSLRLPYFIPTLFLFALIIGAILSLFLNTFRIWYFWGLSLYLLLVLILSIIGTVPERGLSLIVKTSLILFVFIGMILTHLTYGYYFLKGLLAKTLSEEKGRVGTVPLEKGSVPEGD